MSSYGTIIIRITFSKTGKRVSLPIIGKRMNIGDTFTQDEFYNDLSVGYCWESGHIIYCPQTKNFSDDEFIYYFDDNYKIVNMSATLMGYYG